MPASNSNQQSKNSIVISIVIAFFIFSLGGWGLGHSIIACYIAVFVLGIILALSVFGKVSAAAPSILRTSSASISRNWKPSLIIVAAVIVAIVLGFSVNRETIENAEHLRLAKIEGEKQADRNAVKQKEEADKKAAALAKLKEEAPKRAEEYAQRIEKLSQQIATGTCGAAAEEIEKIKLGLSAYNGIDPQLPEIAALQTKLAALSEPLTQCQKQQNNVNTLEEAIKVVNNPDYCKAPQLVERSCKSLQAFSPDDSNYKKAQSIAAKLDNCRDKQRRDLKREMKKEAIDRRMDYPRILDRTFLDRGMDTTISLEGKKKDVLKIKYVLFNRVWVHKMTDNGSIAKGSFLGNLVELGFTKIIFSDGFSKSYSIDLPGDDKKLIEETYRFLGIDGKCMP